MSTSAPTSYDEIEHVWIEMPDGTRLAARMWLPHGAREEPVPAILEIIPYRKGDMVRARDERNHPFFAANGFACLRVDMRGSGDSEGLMSDMYEADELKDTWHVIDWIAGQSWCNGRVGMFGTSWGGTASLQASVDAPDSLKAVIAVCATHDRYEDDIHHMGGCLLTDSIEWGATLPAILASPPSPETVGPAWREMWEHRLENLAFPLETWVREEARGDYWRWGSVKFSSERMSTPILAIGGWSDRYSNSVMSLHHARPDLVWGIVGPWGHHYPDAGHPGPAMNFQKVALEWWNHWLRPEDSSSLEWPKLRVWLREFDPPGDVLDSRNGSWIEQGETSALQFHLREGVLSDTEGADHQADATAVPCDLRVGQASGDTGYFGRFGGLPFDQGADDALSLVYESPVLSEDVILYGAAIFDCVIEAVSLMGQLSLRINDVSSNGEVSRVVMATRNLALDDMLDEVPGSGEGKRQAQVKFPTTAYRFKAGHKIRLAVSASNWPLVWPSPEIVEFKLVEATTTLKLPVLQGEPAKLSQMLPDAADFNNDRYSSIEAPQLIRTSQTQPDGTLISEWQQPAVRTLQHQTGVTFGYETRARNEIRVNEPASANSRYEHTLEFQRPDGTARIHSWVSVSCDRSQYHLSGQLSAFWNDEEIFVRSWSPTVKRRCS